MKLFCENETRKDCDFVHKIIQEHAIKNNLPTQKLKCYPNERDIQKNSDDCGTMSYGYLIQLMQGKTIKKINIKQIRQWVWSNAFEESAITSKGRAPIKDSTYNKKISKTIKNELNIKANNYNKTLTFKDRHIIIYANSIIRNADHICLHYETVKAIATQNEEFIKR